MAFRRRAVRVDEARMAAHTAVRVVRGRVDARTGALRAAPRADAGAIRARGGRRARRAARVAVTGVGQEVHASARACVRAGGAHAVEVSTARTAFAAHVARTAVLF